MSSTSALSSRQRVFIAIIVIFFSFVLQDYFGLPEATLFFCGASTGAILTIEFRDKLQVGKSLYISIALILLISGAVLIGGGIPFVGSGSSNVVTGTVYESGTPVSGQTVELINQSNEAQLITSTTNADGEFRFNTSGFSGPYIVSVGVKERGGVADGDTNLEFGDPPGLLSGLPIIGSSDNTAEGDGDDQNENDSSDSESTGDSPPLQSTGDSPPLANQSTTEETQLISYVEGSVVREEDIQTAPVASAIVTLEDSEGNVISAESNETTVEGNYRIDNIDMTAFEGNIESGQIYIIVEKEDEFRVRKAIELQIYPSPYEIGPQTVVVTEEDRIGTAPNQQ